MNKVKISAVIITLNEEKKIQACIDSLKDVVDEIVVVDSFSTDQTKEICESNGVRFIQHAWPGYGAQKNWGNGQATYDCILSLDADERLSNDLKKAILAIKEDWQYDIYSLNILTYLHDRALKHCLYPDPHLRLFDKRKTKWKESKVHESIITGPGITVKRIRKDILHYPNENIHALVSTLNDNSTLWARGNFEAGKKPDILKMVFSPTFAFVKTYIFKLGFLDGVFGFITCLNMAHYRFLKYAKLIELSRVAGTDKKHGEC